MDACPLSLRALVAADNRLVSSIAARPFRSHGEGATTGRLRPCNEGAGGGRALSFWAQATTHRGRDGDLRCLMRGYATIALKNPGGKLRFGFAIQRLEPTVETSYLSLI